MRERLATRPGALLALLALCLTTAALTAGSAIADDGHRETHRKIYVHRVDTDGEDGHHRVEVHDGGHHGFHTGYGKGGYLGVQLSEMTPELRTHFGAPEDAGVLVSKVVADSPAFRAGIEVGDIIAAVNGESVRSPRHLAREIRRGDDGDTVTLEVWRAGRVETLSPVLETREHAGHHGFVVCEDGEDCGLDLAWLASVDCGEAEDCTVQVRCEDGTCECTLGGEPHDCEAIEGFHPPGN